MNLVSILKCRQCHKLFAAPSGHAVCQKCTVRRLEQVDRVHEAVGRLGMTDPEEIAAYANMSPADTERIMRDAGYLGETSGSHLVCRRCKKESALPESSYCLGCRLELEHALESAASSVFRKVLGKANRIPDGTSSLHGVASSLDEKRRHHRGGEYTPRNRWG